MSREKSITLFVLLGLLALTVVAVLAANAGFLGENSQTLQFAKWGLGAVLVETIGLCAFIVKGLFKPRRSSLWLSLPKNLESIDIRSIDWDEKNCMISSENFSAQIHLVPSPVGPSLRVHIPESIIEKIQDMEYIRISLKDKAGNQWEVRPFYLFENLQEMIPSQTVQALKSITRVEEYD